MVKLIIIYLYSWTIECIREAGRFAVSLSFNSWCCGPSVREMTGDQE